MQISKVYTDLCKLQGAATYMSHLQPGSTLNQEIKTLLESDQGIKMNSRNCKNQQIKNAQLQFNLWTTEKLSDQKRMIKWSSPLFAQIKKFISVATASTGDK